MSISSQFKGLPMGDLIGAPLIAACDAQGQLAKQTSDFINAVGVDKDKKIKTVDFGYSTTETKSDGSVGDVTKTISVPQLSMVNIPNLKIKKVDVNFEMEVKQQTESKDTSEKKLDTKIKTKSWWSPVSAEITGSISSKSENTRKSDTSAKYTVSVHAEDDGMPEGLSRILTMFSNLITEKEGEPKKDSEES